MDYGFTTAAYVVAAVLFIQSLGGLSGQESAKRAVWYGIAGMALAVLATLYGPGIGNWYVSVVMIAIGGAIGWVVAQRVQMTEMPQLVAAMHSLVGLAAVFIGFNTHIEMVRVMGMDEAARAALEGFAAVVAHKSGVEVSILRVETFLGIFIGAVTFTGSVIAFGKLAGKVDGKVVARSPRLARTVAKLPRLAFERASIGARNVAVNNGHRAYPLITTSYSAPGTSPHWLNDGQIWYHQAPPNRWTPSAT